MEKHLRYIALKLDWASVVALKKSAPPRHGMEYYDHITLVYRPDADVLARYLTLVGKQAAAVVTKEVWNDLCQTVAVTLEGVVSENVAPHVTLSTIKDVRPDYSNTLLEMDAGWQSRTLLLRLTGTVVAVYREQPT